MKLLFFFFFLLFILGIAILTRFLFKRKIQIWLPNYLKNILKKKIFPEKNELPIHILFCLVDHYEPGWNKADSALANERVDAWVDKYPRFAEAFTDSDGYHPRHTWFYPPHYYTAENIQKLLKLCKQGFGEIEMHLHHNRMEPFQDTSETVRQKILTCIDTYSQFGIFKTTVNGESVIQYAFIHGDWALDGSREGYCNINDELTILQGTGCYADFTFPSYMVESQPQLVNSIYYAIDDPKKPKSYNTGSLARVGEKNARGLLMVQGPLGFRWKGRKRKYFPSVDDGEIAGNNPPTRERVDFWVNTGVHVLGRPDWVIVKAFTHGAPKREHKTLLGVPIITMHNHLKEKYNNGTSHYLHYVTSRELYNIIKAAEAGETGNPGDYRNYLIKEYDYLR